MNPTGKLDEQEASPVVNCRTKTVLSIIALGTCIPGCTTRTRTPPEVHVDSNVLVDWRGHGVESGSVLAIDGHWVKMRFEYTEEPSDPTRLVGAVVEPWINFERVASYRTTTRR